MIAARRLATIAATLALLTAAAARADQSYDVSGNDSYQIGTAAKPTVITYDGTQQLTESTTKDVLRFVASAHYTRTNDDRSAVLRARFVQDMERDGSFDDMSDQDPDFLTILNQAFAVQLDPRTLHDLRALHGSVPFEATSPLAGARLAGTLRAARPGTVHGLAVVGVHFSAAGPMTGTLPDHADAKLEGTIHMDGTAFYSSREALLLALDATLTIDGKLGTADATVPVRIVYHRRIRASSP